MTAQNAAAAAPTTGVIPAAADEVSALTAAQFATHAEMY
jgi:PE family